VGPRTTMKASLVYLRTTPWRHIGQWRYSSTHFNLGHWMEVSGQLHTQAAIPPGKEPLVSTG